MSTIIFRLLTEKYRCEKAFDDRVDDRFEIAASRHSTTAIKCSNGTLTLSSCGFMEREKYALFLDNKLLKLDSRFIS